jgi:hypothetical protein
MLQFQCDCPAKASVEPVMNTRIIDILTLRDQAKRISRCSRAWKPESSHTDMQNFDIGLSGLDTQRVEYQQKSG